VNVDANNKMNRLKLALTALIFFIMNTSSHSSEIAQHIENAKNGDPDAIFRVGYAFANGIDVPRDEVKAVAWFRKGAELENSPSIACLGALAWAGQGMEQDYPSAKAWFKRAEAIGNSWAPFMLGVMSENGHGGPIDMEKAISYYKESAEGGYYQAQIRCAILHREGDQVPDYDVEIKWLLKGMDSCGPQDAFLLGLVYEHGYLVDKDIYQAFIFQSSSAHFDMAAAKMRRDKLKPLLDTDDLQQAESEVQKRVARLKKDKARIF
jgi:hypothetical protein